MIDAKAFGIELAGIVKTATAPLLARIDELEKRVAEFSVEVEVQTPDPDGVASIVVDRLKADMPEPGLSGADLDRLAGIAAERAEKAAQRAAEAFLATIPAPKDGEDGKGVTVEDVAPLVEAEIAKAVASIPAAKDGVGLAGALIDRDGNLVVTLTNGEAKSLGPVVGRDGVDGKGNDGVDGLGFEDMSFEEKDGRLYAVFRRGEVEKSARIPSMSYRGVWKAVDYLQGDTVTWGGSMFTATKDTSSKPETDDSWKLAVKKGRDGKGS